MNLFSRIAIGTANWEKEYNGVRVSDDDQKRILDYAQCSSIDTIDTATAYDWDWTKIKTCFNLIIKINENDSLGRIKEIVDSKPYCLMAHDTHVLGKVSDFIRHTSIKKGISLYEPFKEYVEKAISVVQVPYSFYDRRFEREFESLTHTEIHVRSIYLRGRIIQDGISPQECLKFVLCNPFVDKVIIGADSFEQFRENVGFLHTWNQLEKHDEKLLDPRKWSDSGKEINNISE